MKKFQFLPLKRRVPFLNEKNCRGFKKVVLQHTHAPTMHTLGKKTGVSF